MPQAHYPDNFRGVLPGERTIRASDIEEFNDELAEDATEWETFERLREAYRKRCRQLMAKMGDDSAKCLAKYLSVEEDVAHDEINDQIAECYGHADFLEEFTS